MEGVRGSPLGLRLIENLGGGESSIPRPSLGGGTEGDCDCCPDVRKGLAGGDVDVDRPYTIDCERGEGANGVRGTGNDWIAVTGANERDSLVAKGVCDTLNWSDCLRACGWPTGRAISDDITRCLAGVWRKDGLRGGTDISGSAGIQWAERGTNVRTRIRSRRRGNKAVARRIF